MSTVLILLGSFLVLLLINVPVAFCMSLACVFAFLWKGALPVLTLPMKLSSGIDTFPFLAIPLFILAGSLMEHGGISQRLVRFAKNLVGHIKGGLGIVVVVSEVFFSGISGSSIADASAIGSLLLPSMVRAGYTPPRAASIIAAATGMGILIPLPQHGRPRGHGQHLHCRSLHGRFPPGVSDGADPDGHHLLPVFERHPAGSGSKEGKVQGSDGRI